MKKALLPLMIASLVPTAAFADVVVYGKAFVSFQNDDLLNGGTYTELKNNESRLGVKGSEAINDDLKAIYQYELKVGVEDGNASGAGMGNGPFTQRNSFIGLQGGFGTFKGGMFDTPLKVAQDKIDVFKDMQGDWKNVLQGEVRAANIVQYSTPTFSNVTANFAYVTSEKDKTGVPTNGYSASLAYDTKPLYLAIANDHNVKAANSAAVIAHDVDVIRLVGRVTFGQVVLGAMYQTYDDGVANTKGDVKKDGYTLSAVYNIDKDWALKAQYAESDQVTLGGKTTSVGVDYKMSKNTKLTGYYTDLKDDNADVTKRHDDKWVGIAMEFNF